MLFYIYIYIRIYSFSCIYIYIIVLYMSRIYLITHILTCINSLNMATTHSVPT